MKQLKTILVACDSLKNIESALQKAAYLEHYTGCEIAVLDVVWDEVEHEALPDHIKSELKEGLLAGERHDLAKAVEGIKNKVASLSYSVVWHKHHVVGQVRARQSRHQIVGSLAARHLHANVGIIACQPSQQRQR